MSAEKTLLKAKQTLKTAEENAVTAQSRFEDVAGRQAVGEEISGSSLQSARRARDEASAALEAAQIGLRAAAEKVTLEQAEALAAAEAADWAACEELGAKFAEHVAELNKLAIDADKVALAILDRAVEIVQRSPAARKRPDVPDLGPSRLRARMQRALELSMPSLYAASSEARYRFQGLNASLLEPLPFFVSKSHDR